MTPSEVARQYIGKLEKPGNSGFQDPVFEVDMINLGEWQKGYSWCCCFAQMCFRKAYPDKSEALKKLFDPSTRKTFDNFKAAGYTVLHEPLQDALVIYGDFENGVLTWNGHAGIVSKVTGVKIFQDIEGNTSGFGSRNGDRVFEHNRSTLLKPSGLNVLGFFKV